MSKTVQTIHLFLLKAHDRRSAEERLLTFLDRYDLIHFDSVKVTRSICMAHDKTGFLQTVDRGISENRKWLAEAVTFLEQEGFEAVRDLNDLPQGYLSKHLHEIVHFLDGFFGIDSMFYNMEEGSHGISRLLKEEMKQAPELFWLLETEACTGRPGFLFEKLKMM